jgi:hypothetical protein
MKANIFFNWFRINLVLIGTILILSLFSCNQEDSKKNSVLADILLMQTEQTKTTSPRNQLVAEIHAAQDRIVRSTADANSISFLTDAEIEAIGTNFEKTSKLTSEDIKFKDPGPIALTVADLPILKTLAYLEINENGIQFPDAIKGNSSMGVRNTGSLIVYCLDLKNKWVAASKSGNFWAWVHYKLINECSGLA